ncbi:hypothetical protein GCM10009801_07960 [Streptomyces albiaxialis]|uniref:DUF397 domain-containing protein n=1 Tax=Streptomyces albiaxialis TaxID=329523 RepID=A0ABN2VLG6_9ACTN
MRPTGPRHPRVPVTDRATSGHPSRPGRPKVPNGPAPVMAPAAWSSFIDALKGGDGELPA